MMIAILIMMVANLIMMLTMITMMIMMTMMMMMTMMIMIKTKMMTRCVQFVLNHIRAEDEETIPTTCGFQRMVKTYTY